MPNEDCTVKDMDAAVRASFAIDQQRTQGALKNDKKTEMIYMIAFASGADWAIKKVKGEL